MAPFDGNTTDFTPVETQEPSLEGLIAFCDRFPANQTYCYSDVGLCLLALYNASIGREYIVSPSGIICSFFDGWWPDTATVLALPIDEMLEKVAFFGEHTFGAAAERARALLGA